MMRQKGIEKREMKDRVKHMMGRGTLGILLFIAGRGRKAYWKRGVGGESGGAEPIQ